MSEGLCPVYRSAELFPNYTFLLTSSCELTYREFEKLVNKAYWYLKDIGISEGDRIGILCSPSPSFLSLIFGSFRLGAAVCLLNCRFPPSLLSIVTKKLALKNVIADREHYPQAIQIQRKVRLVKAFLLSDSNLTHSGPSYPKVMLQREATILTTSGSTGHPKGVMHSLHSHLFSARGSLSRLDIAAGDRYLLSLPIYHVGGLAILFRTILSGACCVIAPSGRKIAQKIERFKVSHISLVSTQLKRLIEEQKGLRRDLRTLKEVLLGGGPTGVKLLSTALELGLPLRTTYGLTETASQVTSTSAERSLEELCTAGTALPYREVSIDERGEILVRGPVLFKGYLPEEASSEPFDKDGWFRTGDLGKFDSKGRLAVIGRKDRMFISGGENIFPEQIEKALLEIEEVKEAAVVPVSDIEFGKRPVAFVKTEPPSFDEKKLRSFLEEFIPRYMLPVRFLPFPEGKRVGIKPCAKELERLAEKEIGKCN